MWKYVTRRLKETFERTCNSLDLCHTWRCGTQQLKQDKDSFSLPSPSSYKDDIQIKRDCFKVFPNVYICTISCDKTNESSDGGQRFRNSDRTPHHNDLLGVITWSGAIVCGWYATNLLCLNRRRYGWDNSSGNCFRMINFPSRALHTNISSHLVFTSPTKPSILSERTLKDKFSIDSSTNISDFPQEQRYKIVEVNNESETTTSSGISSSSKTSEKQTVDEAINGLVKFLGETEFKMGIQYISAGQYRSAVTHLKLASRHHHVGATFNLGLCYEQGLGVSKSLKRAMQCYQYASSMGHAKAMYNLGVYYAQGLGGLSKDHEAARQCFIAAAKLGQNEAKTVLGWSSIPPSSVITSRIASLEEDGIQM